MFARAHARALWYPGARRANQLGKPASAAKIVAQNKEELYWISTLAFDNRGNVLVTSNKLAASFSKATDFTQTSMRIVSLPVRTDSYMKAASETDKGTWEDYFGS